MAIAKMALVSIAGDLGQLDDVIMQCLGSGAFHPEPPLQAAGGIRGFTPLAEENPYGPLLAKITDAGVAAGLTPHYDPGLRARRFRRATARISAPPSGKRRRRCASGRTICTARSSRMNRGL